MTGTPVIVTGLVESMTTVPWSIQHIKEVGDAFYQFYNAKYNIILLVI